ncbi:MAG: hypothetical protein KF690_03215 [Bacteroidetes bacterium]|nr:hypothetical protein [Bacteroidota bacterium]
MFKLDGVRAAVHGEFRCMGEFQQSRHLSLLGTLGWVNTATSAAPSDERDHALYAHGRPLFTVHTLDAAAHLPGLAHERVQGGMLQVGARWYFLPGPPLTRLYVEATLGDALLYSRFFSSEKKELIGRIAGHQPQAALLAGWQWILGHHRVFTLDLGAGARVGMYLPLKGDISPEYAAKIRFQPVLSAQLGIAIFKFR